MLPIGSSTSTLNTIQINHQILNSAHLNTPLLSKSQTSVPTHHTIIPSNLRNALSNLPILNKLGNNTSRCLASKLTEIDRSLGVACSLAHATGTRLQWDDVAWSAERVDLRGG